MNDQVSKWYMFAAIILAIALFWAMTSRWDLQDQIDTQEATILRLQFQASDQPKTARSQTNDYFFMILECLREDGVEIKGPWDPDSRAAVSWCVDWIYD